MRLEEKQEGERQEHLFRQMLATRSIMLSGVIDKVMAQRVISQLILMEQEKDTPIKLFIDSPGGDADAGFAIFDMARFVRPQVHTIGMGLVASAGALVLLAAPIERRFGLPNSHYLIHQPLSSMRGAATDIEIHAREIEKMRSRINRLISGETGNPLKQVQKDTDRDYWMSATEAKNYNLISTIVEHHDDLA